MASPNTMKKVKWPSEKKKAGTNVSDFVPYASNLVNMFRKVPRPMAPKTIDPVTGTTVSLADTKRQVSDTTRAADLSTENLDAQTGAAIRVGNLGNKLRSLSELNSKEAQINAQMGNQTKMINANIDSQNAQITNAYHDDITNSQIAQQREQSENLSNAADKFITQRAYRDQYELDKEKTNIMSKMYNPGVYSRLMDSINGKPPSMFDKYKNMDLPDATPTPTSVAWPPAPTASANPMTPYPGTGPLNSNAESDSVPSFMRRKTAPKYFVNKFAAGGMMKVFDEDPVKPNTTASGMPATGGTATLYKPNDTLLIKDTRKTDPVVGGNLRNRKTMTAKSDDLETIIAHAKAKGVNPNDALSIAYQESGFGKSQTGYGEVNNYSADQDVSDSFLNINERRKNEDANMLSKALKDKNAYAHQLGFDQKGEAFRLQAYNGYGKLGTKLGSSSYYGIPVNKGNNLDLSKNPAYGKTVISLRDEVLSKQPDLQKMVNETPAFKPYAGFSNGGRMKKRYRAGGKLTKPFA